MSKVRKDSGVIRDIMLIILLLAFFSSLFATDFLAKYRSGDTRDDAARVALWNVDMTSGAQIEVLPDGTGSVTYPITVTNRSEVAVSYDVIIRFGQSVAGKITNPRLGGAAPTEGAAFTDRLTFRAAGTLPAAAGTPQSETINLTFDVPAEFFESFSSAGDDYDNDIISSDALNIAFTVSVQIVQTD
ncbi:MAG: hypothetical protein IKI50_06550 [Clostridia bacterium]|nr:hypothetical protein [Clostridia bacterium]